MNILILLLALIKVESSQNDHAIGDGGNSWGCLQISEIMLVDVMRITGRQYTKDDRFNRGKSIEIALAYFNHYGDGRSIEGLARMWSGGPDGWEQIEATQDHWDKVSFEIDRMDGMEVSLVMDLLYGEEEL
jgi:hypothetical protein